MFQCKSCERFLVDSMNKCIYCDSSDLKKFVPYSIDTSNYKINIDYINIHNKNYANG